MHPFIELASVYWTCIRILNLHPCIQLASVYWACRSILELYNTAGDVHATMFAEPFISKFWKAIQIPNIYIHLPWSRYHPNPYETKLLFVASSHPRTIIFNHFFRDHFLEIPDIFCFVLLSPPKRVRRPSFWMIKRQAGSEKHEDFIFDCFGVQKIPLTSKSHCLAPIVWVLFWHQRLTGGFLFPREPPR